MDPTGDPTTLLSSLTSGTEVEIQFGRSLQVCPISAQVCSIDSRFLAARNVGYVHLFPVTRNQQTRSMSAACNSGDHGRMPLAQQQGMSMLMVSW